ncbi:class I SAM-dependent methyltransferase [Rhodopila sp.]|uniref:class I SAM-dependent methyltransferase n=1 Tax=Rhodopila sp. TaxID=2480087 RepID=UPI003D11CFDA
MNIVDDDAMGSGGPDRDMVDGSSKRGGNPAAIRHHYDLSNAFYALWLDQTLTYSCALWNESDDPDDLTAAQLRKLDFHLAAAGAARGRRILDIGCGWGSLLRRAVSQTAIEQATGLTLSEAQFRHIDAWHDGRVQVLKESWIDHAPAAKYDSIVSIGALEHFASPGDSPKQKIGLYREFLRKCRGWLAPLGAMSLQTIAYGTMQPNENNAFISTEIFPDSELPQAHEIIEAASGVFEVTLLRNDRAQYGRTCDLWYRTLHRRRDEAVAIVGEEKVRQYEAYLRMSAFGFHSGRVGLLRLAMVPVLGS